MKNTLHVFASKTSTKTVEINGHWNKVAYSKLYEALR